MWFGVLFFIDTGGALGTGVQPDGPSAGQYPACCPQVLQLPKLTFWGVCCNFLFFFFKLTVSLRISRRAPLSGWTQTRTFPQDKLRGARSVLICLEAFMPHASFLFFFPSQPLSLFSFLPVTEGEGPLLDGVREGLRHLLLAKATQPRCVMTAEGRSPASKDP